MKEKSLKEQIAEIKGKFKENERCLREYRYDPTNMLKLMVRNSKKVGEYYLYQSYRDTVSNVFADEFGYRLWPDTYKIDELGFQASSTALTYDELVKEFINFMERRSL